VHKQTNKQHSLNLVCCNISTLQPASLTVLSRYNRRVPAFICLWY